MAAMAMTERSSMRALVLAREEGSDAIIGGRRSTSPRGAEQSSF
jgi:hypothetical protein